MKNKTKSKIISVFLAALIAFTAIPGVAFAEGEDTQYTVEAAANSENGDVVKEAGNVTPIRKVNGDAYGVKASAEAGKTATVTVKDIDVYIGSADFQFGVAAWAGNDIDEPNTSGTVNVTCGNVISNEYGIEASASVDSNTTVTVNGDIQAGAHGGTWGYGVYSGARTGSSTKVFVNGNVTSPSLGLHVDANQIEGKRTANASIEVNGDVTATNGDGVKFVGRWDTQNILVTGTITGGSHGVLTDVYYADSLAGTNNLTVWKVAAGSGNSDDLFAKLTAYNTYAVDEESAKTAKYIIKHDDSVTPLKLDGSALDSSHGYSVAKEGEKILITAANGNVVTKAYNGGEEITTKNENGFYYYTVPRGGGVNITAEIGDVPAPDPQAKIKVELPKGKTLTYNGKAQTGVLSGTGYTLSETVTATKAGTYTAKATLKEGYVWADGGTDIKNISWKINKAPNPLTVKAKKPALKFAKLKKKNQTIARNKAITVSKAQGKTTFKKASGNKKITVAKNGKITVKKGLKKGRYKVKIKVTAAGNANYNKVTKTVTVTIKVK